MLLLLFLGSRIAWSPFDFVDEVLSDTVCKRPTAEDGRRRVDATLVALPQLGALRSPLLRA
jgi:hypothetical protein